MTRRRYSIDDDKIERFFKEGRGSGHGVDYKPWLTIKDVSSQGLSSRIYSKNTGRQHHFLSNLETSLFLLLDWNDRVIDIREQFPLDRQVTRMLAAKMGIVHPRDTHTQTDIVMTTDILVDIRHDGYTRPVALSVKPSNKLEDTRTLEKLELERRYWARDRIAWHLVTEYELPAIRVANLRWLHEMQSLEALQAPHKNYWSDRCARFLKELTSVRSGLIQDFLRHLQENCEFAEGEPMTVLRHLAAIKRITFDLDRQFSAQNQISILGVVQDSAAQRRVA